jgi:NAD(P)-dependent dehydrogenase (short-subunit alcohol dehydrogenase family)
MTVSMANMNGKVVVLSGRVGRTGFEVCRRFCESGMHLAIFGSRREELGKTEFLLSQFGFSCLAIECDVADTKAVKLAMAQTNDRFGHIDVVVPILEWLPKKEEFADISDESWNDALSSHLTGSLHMLQHAIPYLENSSSPRVIFLATHGARYGNCEESLAYSVAKSGIFSLTYHVAKTLAEKGITVNCIATVGNNSIYGPDEIEDALINQSSGKGICSLKVVSDAVRYLAGEEAGFITGKVLDVNGGLFNLLIPASEYSYSGQEAGN